MYFIKATPHNSRRSPCNPHFSLFHLRESCGVALKLYNTAYSGLPADRVLFLTVIPRSNQRLRRGNPTKWSSYVSFPLCGIATALAGFAMTAKGIAMTINIKYRVSACSVILL